MRAEIAENPGAAARGQAAPARCAVQSEPAMILAGNMQHASDITLCHQSAKRLHVGIVAVRKVRHTEQAACLGGFRHLAGLVRVQGHRLLTDNMQAAPQRRHRRRVMQVVGCTDDHRIERDRVEHRLHVRKNLNVCAVPRLRLRLVPRFRAADRCDLCLRMILQSR
jgi:hypothetical protein